MWDSSTGHQYITGSPLETHQLGPNGILRPVELSGETHPRHSLMEDEFSITTTIGAAQDDQRIYQNSADADRIGNLVSIGGGNFVQEYRSAIYGPHLIPFLRIRRSVRGSQIESYPLAVSNFGLGYLFVSGFTPNSIGWSVKIVTAINNLCQRISEKGSV